MSDEKKKRRSTLADALDATEWDFKPGKGGKILLRPAGAVFGEVPWEVQSQYLGPAPVAELEPEIEGDTEPDDDEADTQPIKSLKE